MSDTGTILGPDGSVVTVPHRALTDEDARILREYRKFLERQHLREALYCTDCWEGDREDGCKAFVRADRILIQCRCTLRTHLGVTP